MSLPVVADTEGYPPLSALNDLLFCPRRCFLHRVEGIWRENIHTTAGTIAHKRAHSEEDSEEPGVKTRRGLPLVSHRLRVVGVADIVEFVPGAGGEVPYPVEYKRGRRRRWDNDDVQLCAQAVCLEEMLGLEVSRGAIYHVKTRRRREVVFDSALRQLTQETADRLHRLLAEQVAPAPVLHARCKECSVEPLCMPKLVSTQDAYLRAAKSLFKVVP